MNKIYNLIVLLLLSASTIMAQTAVIGAGSSSGATGDNAGPIYRSSAGSGFDFSQHYYLFTASELAAAGVISGSTISSIAWFKSNAFGTAATNTTSKMDVYMKNTATQPSATWSSSSFATQSTGATLVYSNNAQVIPTTIGFVTLTFSTPFLYTGGSLEVGVSWDCSIFAGSPTTGGISWTRDPATNSCFGGSNSTSTITMALQANRPMTTLGYTPPPACTAAPTTVTVSASTTTVACPGGALSLSATVDPAAFSGYTYQWESSPDNVTWTPISGATSVSYNTNLSATTYFRVVASCGASSNTSTEVQVTGTAPSAITSANKWTENFDALTTIGATSFPSCWTKESGAYQTSNAGHNTYHDPKSASNYVTIQWSQTNAWLWTPTFALKKDTTYEFGFFAIGDNFTGWTGDVGVNTSASSVGATILGTSFYTTAVAAPQQYQYVYQRFTPTADGNYSFGIRINANGTPWYLGFDDFSLEVYNPQPPTCVTAIAPTNNSTDVCTNQALGLSWNPDTKATDYDVYFGTNPASLSLVTTTTTTSYSVPSGTMTGNTTYFWQVVPKNAIGSAMGCVIDSFKTAGAPCPCVPIYTTGKTFGDLIANIAISGTTLANNTGTAQVNPAYTFFPPSLGANYTANLSAGTSYVVSVSIGTWGNQGLAAWIDYDDDGVFTTAERIGYTNGTIGTGSGGTPIPANHTTTFNISLPCNPQVGAHRMRIREVYALSGANIDPCISYTYGETEDYIVTVLPPPPCPQPGFLVGTTTAPTWSSVSLDWTLGCTETAWDVFIQPAGGTAPTNATTPTYAKVTAHPFVVTGLNPSTTYEFWIRAVCDTATATFVASDWSGPSSVTTGIAPPDCPTYNTPPDMATYVPLSTSLTWTAATTGSPATGYQVFWGQTLPTTATATLGTVTTYLPANDYNTTYVWQIQPTNTAGANTTCPTFTYTTDTLKLPDCPTMTAPAAAATGVVINPTLSWNTVIGAASYDLYVSTSTPVALTAGNLVTNTTTTSYQYTTPLAANTTYYWVAIAKNAKGDSQNCTESSFTTGTFLGYCTPTFNSFGCNDGDVIARVVLNTLDNDSGTGCPGGATGYSDYRNNPALTTTLNAGTSYGCTIWAGQYSETYAAWIDFNDNGIFETSERIGYTATAIAGSGQVGVLGSSATFTLSLPCNPPVGVHTMRIRCAFATAGASIVPCGPGNGTNNGYGEVEDYIITVAPPPPCPSPSNLAVANVTATNADLSWTIGCTETEWDVHLTNVGGGAPTGAASNPGVMTTPTLALTGLNAGTSYEYWVRAVCGAGTNSSWVGPFTFTTQFLPPANDDPCNATALVLNAPPVCQNTTGATVSAAESGSNLPSIFLSSALNNTVWFTFTPTTTDAYKITMSYPSTSTTLKQTWTAIYTEAGNCPTGTLAFTQVMAEVGNSTGASLDINTPTLTAGTTYYIFVDGVAGSFGDFCIQISDNNPKVSAKVYLTHFDMTSSLMDNYVASISNFPTADPYAATGAFNGNYTLVSHNTGATVSPAAMAVTGNNAIVDWVFMELRQGPSSATSVVRTSSALLQRDGDIVDVDGVSPVKFPGLAAGTYYVTIRHRNHLGFRTGGLFPISTNTIPMDFTNGSFPLYGTTPIYSLTPTVYVMNGGDANSDGSVDAFDSIDWEAQNGLFDDYTNNADYNMDGSVDALDSITWEIHNGKFQEF